jgi:hypothetical protein
MSKIGMALGSKYEEHRLAVLTRTFELGGHTFKVRVPSVQEIESIYNYFKNPDDAKVEEVYQELIKDIVQYKDKAPENIKFEENDVTIDGRSMKEAARNKLALQYRIVEYIKFLIPELEGGLDNLEYADVEAEFPLAIQLELVEKINEVISPDYKEVRLK